MPSIDVNAYMAIIEEATHQFDEKRHIWLEYCETDLVLQQQILDTVDHIYLSPLLDIITGFTNSTTHDLLEHLYDTYGNINPKTLASVNEQFRYPYIPN